MTISLLTPNRFDAVVQAKSRLKSWLYCLIPGCQWIELSIFLCENSVHDEGVEGRGSFRWQDLSSTLSIQLVDGFYETRLPVKVSPSKYDVQLLCRIDLHNKCRSISGMSSVQTSVTRHAMESKEGRIGGRNISSETVLSSYIFLRFIAMETILTN